MTLQMTRNDLEGPRLLSQNDLINLHTWNKLEILQDIMQFKTIWMEGQEHFDVRAGTLLRKGRIIIEG